MDSDAQKAEELLRAIDLDSAPFHVTDAGALNIKLKVQYSPTFGAATLSWDRVTNRYTCQTFTTFPLTVSEVWDEEAEYRVWADGKLLAHFPRRLRISSPASIGINFTYPASIPVRASLSIGTSPFDTATRVGPFYDFDASSIGRFGNYSVTAHIAGCGPNTAGPSWGSRSGQSQVALARDVTGRPSFFPPAEYAARQSNGPWLGTQVATTSDSSGKLTVAVFERTSPNEYKQPKRFWVSVPDDYVVVGGGAVAANAPFGNLLTASNPTDDLRAWEVSAKDHYYSNPIKIRAWAIGLKVAGLTREQLRQHITVTKSTSAAANHPTASASVGQGYILIGGGFRDNWSDYGNLGTSSYPSSSSSWTASGKDHYISSPATMDAFAIGIRNNIPGIGMLVSNYQVAGSSYAGNPSSEISASGGSVRVGCGAKINWNGYGNLLWKIQPTAENGCLASGKDHRAASPATIDTYAIGLGLMP